MSCSFPGLTDSPGLFTFLLPPSCQPGEVSISIWCCSVAKSCATLCDSMDCSTPGFLVLHYLPECAQIHVHWASDAIQLPHPPALNLSQHQSLFQWKMPLANSYGTFHYDLSEHFFFLLSFLFCFGVQLINNADSFGWTVKGLSHTYTCIHSPPNLLPPGLPHNIDQSSMCWTIGPCWLSILNTAVRTCPSQTP